MDVSARMPRLRQAIGPEASLLVTSLKNVRYLTGFTGSAGMLFVFPASAVLLTDGRYETQANRQLADAGADVSVSIAPVAGQRDRAVALVADGSARVLGLEAAHVSWARQRTLAGDWFPDVELEPTVGLVEQLRAVKDEAEVDRLLAAAQIADQALERSRPMLDTSPTEEEFGRTLDYEMRHLGAAGPSFETIVASGPNGAMPHHRPGPRSVERGEPVVLDFGAMVDGYCSDMTRTVWVDRLAEADLRRAYDVVLEAQAAGVAAVRAGVACAEVDAACREVIGAAGWGDRFVHGTGHGVGLDIHEFPSVGATSTDTLVAGHVVTVEPGVYLPGLGGVRIEDTVVVTDGGCRPLTSTPKDRP
jgi:Xaa-Pro aminopeptidase